MPTDNSKSINLNEYVADLSDEMFLKMLVHESNNFLSPISGFTEIIQMEDSLDAKQQSYLKEVTTAVQRHVEFNQQLLMMSGKMQPKIEEIGSDELIALINSEKFIIDSKLNHAVAFKANRSWLIKVADGLLNFAKSLQQSTSKIQLSKDDNYLKVTVKFSTKPDSIDKNRFFQPFYTSRKLTSEKGLGLCWLPALMKNIGGQLELEIEVLGGVELSLLFLLTA